MTRGGGARVTILSWRRRRRYKTFLQRSSHSGMSVERYMRDVNGPKLAAEGQARLLRLAGAGLKISLTVAVVRRRAPRALEGKRRLRRDAETRRAARRTIL